jgi:hypothetical protein
VVLICFDQQKFPSQSRSFAKNSAFAPCSDLISRALSRSASLALQEISPQKNSIALKWCKQEQDVEESAVSCRRDPIFHTLINNCVENLIVQKYFSWSSAQLLPAASSQVLTAAEPKC